MCRTILRCRLSERAVHGARGGVLVLRHVVRVRMRVRMRVVRRVAQRRWRRAVARAQMRSRSVVLGVMQRQRRARRPPVPALLHLNAGGASVGASRCAAACAAPRARQRVRVRMRRVPAPRVALAPRHFEMRRALAAPALMHPCIRSQ